MKFLRKINRGLVLSLIVLIGVTIYLVTQSIAQSQMMPKIKEVCRKYIDTAISYKMLPDKYRKENPDIPTTELKKYTDDMAKDIKAFYVDNEQTYKNLIANNTAELENQAKGREIIYSYKKEIADYKKVIFERNTVTITLQTNSTMDGPDITAPGMKREKITAQTTDTIILQKQDGEWKVIYADLQRPIKNMYNNGVMTQTVMVH